MMPIQLRKKPAKNHAVALIWELRRRAENLGLADVLRMELIVALQCCEHPDLVEGVRALLVDKDNAPRWSPHSLEGGPASIAEYFAAPWPSWANQSHPLVDLQNEAPPRKLNTANPIRPDP